ncbi:MAG: diguanylate cyclase [Candidatus Gastranaerophilales bacterium]|nr:diguanylate cyclase [Candidatus Gastranaerophilales bacterium]
MDNNISSISAMDVYKRNIELENEIKSKTEELNKANNTMLTMSSIWEMMNSSEPLANVMDTIVNSLQDHMGYVNTLVLTKELDENGSYFIVKSHSESEIVKKFEEKDPLIKVKDYHIQYNENFILANALKERKIQSSTDIKNILHGLMSTLSYEFVQEVVRATKSQSVIVVPIYRKQHESFKADQEFGCLMVFSSRSDVTPKEMNFLTVFANQIELAVTIAALFEEVRKQAVTDPLTGLYNRRYFEENINREAERALRLGQPFSLVSLDLDHLKTINDTYGHQYGDVAIKTISDVLKQKARSIDIPARIGGEEFNVLLPGVDSCGAMMAAERIRAAIEATPLEKIGNVTASIGVATFLEHSRNVFELTELADQAMYQAKINGRNQVKLTKKTKEVNWQRIAINAFLDIISKQRVQIPEEIAGDITTRLSSVSTQDKEAKEVIYSVVDIITQSYNSTYQSGFTKSKLMLAVKLAKAMQMKNNEIDKLKIAILLYDIGNIMIPEKIFKKEDALTEEEKELIKTHPVIAARDILKPISSIQDIIPIIEKHHENWDGSGYPGKASGKDIPLASQIILLVDAYYALTQDRPYRKAFDIDKTVDIIQQGAGIKWSQELVDKFVPLVKHYDAD